MANIRIRQLAPGAPTPTARLPFEEAVSGNTLYVEAQDLGTGGGLIPSATTTYFSNAGSNLNDGLTRNNPVETLAYAQSITASGGTIICGDASILPGVEIYKRVIVYAPFCRIEGQVLFTEVEDPGSAQTFVCDTVYHAGNSSPVIANGQPASQGICTLIANNCFGLFNTTETHFTTFNKTLALDVKRSQGSGTLANGLFDYKTDGKITGRIINALNFSELDSSAVKEPGRIFVDIKRSSVTRGGYNTAIIANSYEATPEARVYTYTDDVVSQYLDVDGFMRLKTLTGFSVVSSAGQPALVLTDAVTVTWDMGKYPDASLTLTALGGGTRELLIANASSLNEGDVAVLDITQSVGGGELVTFEAGYVTPGGASYTPTPAAGSSDRLIFRKKSGTSLVGYTSQKTFL